jgi:sarcosine oxidase, subunit delta
MKILTCPINGPRPLQEFVFGGEVRPMPDPAAATDQQWADYVFNREGQPGVHKEWWYHLASGTWFIAERDNLKDVIVRTYLPAASDVATGTQGAASRGGGASGGEHGK